MQQQARAEAPAPPPAAADQTQPARQQGPKIPPAEVETWRSLYKYYAKYAPALREAAMLDDDNERASQVFRAAAQELNDVFHSGHIGEALAAPLYALLETVFREAQGQSD